MTRRVLSAQFEKFDGHRSVVVRWLPVGKLRAQVLFVPAFGDEMNQTRRMVRLASEALSERGIAASMFDLLGTGDSSADFEEATVDSWLADCRTMVSRMSDPSVPLFLIGCRLGAALAGRVSGQLSCPVAALIGWAPMLQGKTQLSALLRVASITRAQASREKEHADAKSQWAAGRVALLGGNPVSPRLAEQLEQLDATDAPSAGGAALIDIRLPVDDRPAVPSDALRQRGAAWTAAGVPTLVHAAPGAAFWNVSDLVDIPALVEITVAEVERFLVGVAA